MDLYSSWRHRRDLSEIGRMYLLVVGLFLLGLLVWEVGQLQGTPWERDAPANDPRLPHYGK